MKQQELEKQFAEVMSNFPNGLRSWQETHHEVVAAIENVRAKDEFSLNANEMIHNIQQTQGSCGFYDLAIRLTNEFEKLHKGREWDGEFFDAIDAFMKAQLS